MVASVRVKSPAQTARRAAWVRGSGFIASAVWFGMWPPDPETVRKHTPSDKRTQTKNGTLSGSRSTFQTTQRAASGRGESLAARLIWPAIYEKGTHGGVPFSGSQVQRITIQREPERAKVSGAP